MTTTRTDPMTGRYYITITTGRDPGPIPDRELLRQGIETGCWNEHGTPAPWPHEITISDYHNWCNQPIPTESNPDPGGEPPF